jgi:hypothetical protein
MVTMTLEEAERIARERLPEEPAEDPLADWRKSMPRPEPEKTSQSLDTAQVDWSLIIHQALKAERALLTEATGSALGEVREELRDEFAAAIEKLRAEFRAEVDRLRAEFSQAREVQSLRVELAEIKTLLTARSRRATPAQPPASTSGNGDARQPQ